MRLWFAPHRSRGHLWVWVLVSTVVVSQSIPAERRPAPDASTVVQRLPNGLTVVLRRNAYPAGRVEVRLVVRAGTSDEAADQRGAAALIAHVAVHGTPRCPRAVLNAYLQSLSPLGVAADTLVQVSATATVYRLNVATDGAALARGVALLTDWARGVPITPGTLEFARQVAPVTRLGDDEPMAVVDSIVEAARVGRGARVARLPWGSNPDLATPAQVAHFEHVWYRPDNMTLVIVGDIDLQQIAPVATAPLRSLPVAPVPLPSRPTGTTTDDQSSLGPLVTVVTDPQTQGPWIQVRYRLPSPPRGAIAPPGGLLDPLYGMILNLRLGAAAGRLQAHVRWASTTLQWDQPSGDLAAVQVRVQTTDGRVPVEGAIDSAVAAVVTEIARAGAYGFTAAEIALAQQLMRPAFEPSVGQAALLVHTVVTRMASLTPTRGLLPQALAEVTPQALQGRAAQWARATPLVVVGVPPGDPIGDTMSAGIAQVVVASRQPPIAPLAIDTAIGIDTLRPSAGATLTAVTQRAIARAVQTGRTPVLFQTEDGCENCIILERLFRQSQIRSLFQSLDILIYNVDTWQLRQDGQIFGYKQYRIPGDRDGFPYLAALARDGTAVGPSLPGASFDDTYYDEAVLATHGAWTVAFVGSTLPQTAAYFARWRTAFQEHAPEAPPR